MGKRISKFLVLALSFFMMMGCSSNTQEQEPGGNNNPPVQEKNKATFDVTNKTIKVDEEFTLSIIDAPKDAEIDWGMRGDAVTYTLNENETSALVKGVNIGSTTIRALVDEKALECVVTVEAKQVTPPPVDEDDPDDLWVDDSYESHTTDTLPAKEGETYEKYSYEPVVGTKIPKITISLNEIEGVVPKLEDTYLTKARKDDKGDYYSCNVTVSNYDGEDLKLNDLLCQIKVRGNYTSNYSKKPYRLKFDKKQAMPGFEGKFKNWVLLADVKDHSMMRNAISFYLGQLLLEGDGFYSSNFRPIELYFIDGTGSERYWGSYLLCEQQEVKDGRVSITDVGDLKGEDGVKGHYNGTDIGYLFEFDGYYTEERPSGSYNPWGSNDFRIGYETGTVGDPTFTISYNNGANYKTVTGGTNRPTQPGFTMKGDLSEDDNSAQLDFISKYVDNVYKIMYEAAINNKAYKFNDNYAGLTLDASLSAEQAVRNVIDVQSLVDTYIISELSCDPDVGWSSFYMDVDFGVEAKDHLMRFEAPWDFDSCYAVRSGNYCISGEGYYAATSSNPWLAILMNTEWFQTAVKNKYRELYQFEILKDVLDFIDNTSDMQIYKDMYAKNFEKWGTRDETGEVRSELARLQTQREHALAFKDWLHTRMNWLSKTWLDGFDVMTFEKTTRVISDGNTALLTNGTKQRFEAEDATYTSVFSPYTGSGSASNSAYLDQSGTGANQSLSFYINATRRKQAYFVARMAYMDGQVSFNSIYINGEKLLIKDEVVLIPSQNTRPNWMELQLHSAWLEEGENDIVFVPKANTSKFDALDIYSKDALSWSK